MTNDFVTDKIRGAIERLGSQRVTAHIKVENIEFVECGYKTDDRFPKDGWRAYDTEEPVGGYDKHCWFRFTVETPEFEAHKKPFLYISTSRLSSDWDASNPQALVYLNGKIAQGIDINHREVALKSGTKYSVYVYFYSGLFHEKTVFIPELRIEDSRITDLYYDIKLPFDALEVYGEWSEHYTFTRTVLDRTVNLLPMRTPYDGEYYEGIAAAGEYLKREYYGGLCGRNNGITVDCIGTTHIDVAWLWTLEQTAEKTVRSFATALALMREYPEYKFMSSQPQLYKYVKEQAPEVYEEIKKRVAEGRWEVEGAMWLEPDCNLISGESMVRQLLLGKKFIKDEFGIDSRILWLPDVFGYSAAMPQILKKSGVDRFVTSKISWNETNVMPCDTFMWRGIDGTEIFTNFLTAQGGAYAQKPWTGAAYGANTSPDQIYGTWNRYHEKEFNNCVINSFGHSDGGGGPTRMQIEQQRRTAYGMPGMPVTEMTFVGEHLDKVEKNFEENTRELKRTPRWVGELYLEYHRGTYTSMAKNKKNNRRAEFMLHNAELLSSAHGVLCGGKYPKKELDESSEIIALNQFHDIIPGSSIEAVYDRSDKDYAKLSETLGEIIGNKIDAVSANIKTGGGVLCFNPLGFARCGTVKVGGVTVETGEIPAYGWRVLPKLKPSRRVSATREKIENDYYVISIDPSGRLSSIYDKRADREVLKPGEFGNELQAFEDFPRAYDNWEISNYYKDKKWVLDEAESIEPVFDGDRAGVKIARKYRSSTITQTIWCYNTVERIDFETEIDWHEHHQILKAAFPFDINSSRATYEIQFGNTERPTHENTSWEAAKFEVCAHKWADISESGYGVSLLNDCKYGYSTLGSTMTLTLLKCGTYPNENADQGHHSFTYSLLPHIGGYREGHTVQRAFELNQPLITRELEGQKKGSLPDNFSLISCDRESVIVDTVKRAEDSGNLVVRLYEAYNGKTTATLSTGFRFKKCMLCDMMENELEEVAPAGTSVTVPVKNFEIVTLKFILK